MKFKNIKEKISLKNLKSFFKSKKKRTIFIIVSVVVIALAFLAWQLYSKKTNAKASATTAEVSRGDINNVIEGTGTVEAISQYEISSLAKGDVVADYFEEGDYVKKDQLLYEVDSSSIAKNISKQQSSVERAKLSYSDAQQNLSDLNVKSTLSGVIVNLYVSVGDNVSNGGKIADVIDSDTLTVSMPFGTDDAKSIHIGDSAAVTVSNQSTTIYGSVSSVGSGSYANSYGAKVTDVEIKVKNPGAISAGTQATAVVGGYACYDSGVFEYGGTKTIVAKVGGEVAKINRKKGDRVENGTTIVTLTSSNVVRSASEAKLSLDDAGLSLDDLYDSLEDYKIKSPIDGKVIQKNIKAGEKMDSNSSSTMAIVADLSTLTFDISIDELDISSIKVGQTVSVEADAIANKTFTGKVSNISIVGTAYQGVTSYPVTVTIDDSENSGLIPGMNVTAKIVVESVENVLRVPVSAIRMGSFVIVKDDGTFEDVSKTMKKRFNAKPNQSNKEEVGDKEKSDKENNSDGQNDSSKEGKPEFDKSQRPNGDGEQKYNRPGENAQDTNGGGTPPQGRPQQGDNENESPRQTSSLFGTMVAKAADEKNPQEDRLKNMLDKLDVPDGYTVVMVQTGLSDGSFIEIKETDGGLKEGDIVLLPDVSTGNKNTNMQGGMGIPGAMGGMPGGMPSNGTRSNFGGGMSGGAPSGFSGGMNGGSRSNSSGGTSGTQQRQ